MVVVTGIPLRGLGLGIKVYQEGKSSYQHIDIEQGADSPVPRAAQDKPYALLGACLGAIVAYELARAVEAGALAPPPVALFVAAVSPPDLYARAVMKLYLTRPLRAEEPAPREEVLAKLRGWRDLPRETVMLAR